MHGKWKAHNFEIYTHRRSDRCTEFVFFLFIFSLLLHYVISFEIIFITGIARAYTHVISFGSLRQTTTLRPMAATMTTCRSDANVSFLLQANELKKKCVTWIIQNEYGRRWDKTIHALCIASVICPAIWSSVLLYNFFPSHQSPFLSIFAFSVPELNLQFFYAIAVGLFHYSFFRIQVTWKQIMPTTFVYHQSSDNDDDIFNFWYLWAWVVCMSFVLRVHVGSIHCDNGCCHNIR